MRARRGAARRAGAGSLAGKRVLVSAGGTREPLDSVRFLGNRSSGRMGVAVAAEAQRRGAEVTLLAANLAVPAPAGVELVETPTAADLAREATGRAARRRRRRDGGRGRRLPARRSRSRASAPKDDEPWSVDARADRRRARALGERDRNGQVLVGFGAEAGEAGLERKRAMLDGKNLDLVVYNDVSAPGHRLRRAGERGHARLGGRRASTCRARRRRRSRRRSSTRSSAC